MRFLAVITLALLVLTGCQTGPDYAAKLERIRPLAEQGDADAQTVLAQLEKQLRREGNRPPRSRQASKPTVTAKKSSSSDVSSPNNLEANIATLKRTNSCPGCYLQGANLQEAKLGLANLSNANLTGTRIHYATFEGTYMEGCTACPFDW